jgi:hypothetical protein
MYFLIISYGIYSFIFSKMFILFPQESCKLLGISITTLIKSIGVFNVGVTVGKFISIINFSFKKTLIGALLLIVIINGIFIFYKVEKIFLILRLLLGLGLGLVISNYLKEVSSTCKNANHEKFVSLLFNNHLVGLPVWFVFQTLLPQKYWLMAIGTLLMGNILYILLMKSNFSERKTSKVVMELSKDFIRKYTYIYVVISIVTGILLFNALLVLLAHCQLQLMYVFSFHKYEKIICQQIPFLVGGICYLCRDLFKQYGFYLLFILFVGNFWLIKSPWLLGVINGLIYGSYVVYVGHFATFLKNFTGHMYSSFMFYGLISLLGLITKFFFLGKLYDIIIQNITHYFLIVGSILIVSYGGVILIETFIEKRKKEENLEVIKVY